MHDDNARDESGKPRSQERRQNTRPAKEQSNPSLHQAPPMVSVTGDQARRTHDGQRRAHGIRRCEARDEDQHRCGENRAAAAKNAEREADHAAQQYHNEVENHGCESQATTKGFDAPKRKQRCGSSG